MKIRYWLIVAAVSILSNLMLTPGFAATKRVNFTLSAVQNQTYEALVKEAESIAATLVEQGFTENPTATEISITILGERNGQQAPILFAKVARSAWQNQRLIQPWTTYPGNASKVILGFSKPQPANVSAASPIANPSNSNAQNGATGQSNSNALNVPATAPSNSAIAPGLSGASLEEGDTGYR